MTKDEARDEVLRRWHALPAEDRHTLEDAQVWAAAFAEELDFRTMGNARKVIAAWLVRDIGDDLPLYAEHPNAPGDDAGDAESPDSVNGALTPSAESESTS